MTLTFYEKPQISASSLKSTAIAGRRLNKARNIGEIGSFKSQLILQEKGILTKPEDKFASFFGKDPDRLVQPHKEMPWFLYRECYRRIPLVYNAVNNTADFALQSGYELDGSADAKEKISKWMDKTNFNLILYNILKQMQVFGNAYLDVSDMSFPKLLQPDNMFVVVSTNPKDDGQVVGYKQINDLDDSKNVDFKPEELIHFKWNDAINPFYGLSEIHPALGAITRYENWQLDLGEILHRYAAPIIHWVVGTDESPATQAEIDDFAPTIENRLPGEDIITSSAIKHEIVGANTNMIQVDGMVKNIQNEIIAALRIPEVFARGGESSNKATAQIELEAFDRKVRALQEAVSFLLEDFLFPKLTSGKTRVVWNEFSAEGELIRAQRIQFYVNSGIPLEPALKMVGMGSWVDDVKKAIQTAMRQTDKAQFRGNAPKGTTDKSQFRQAMQPKK